MLKQVEGSHAVAEAVGLCRPEVISAYPITPQTHIVEDLGTMVKSGKIEDCEFLLVESEFGALSACIGSSAAGARSYTATSSQGMLFMMEAVYNASGMGLPIVMTVGNRAIGAPINIWNDWSDSMSARDAGWIQLFAEDNQQAVDVHIQAFKLAEKTSLPVMVCMDGFILTHSYSQVDMPDQSQVDEFLPKFQPRQVLDPSNPLSMGAMVGPEAFTEVRFLAHKMINDSLITIEEQAAEFKAIFGRDSGGLIKKFDSDGAETVIITLGSVIGTMKEVLSNMRDDGHSIGAVTIRSFRPFPTEALREALKDAKNVIVFEKCLAVGMGGIVANNVRMALQHGEQKVHTVIGGLGGRPITRAGLRRMFEKGINGELCETHFHDINMEIVDREMDRIKAQPNSGSTAENILQDLGVVSAAKTI